MAHSVSNSSSGESDVSSCACTHVQIYASEYNRRTRLKPSCTEKECVTLERSPFPKSQERRSRQALTLRLLRLLALCCSRASAGCSACLNASVFLRTASSPAHAALRPAHTPLLKATSSRIYKREPQRSHSCQLYPIGHSGRSKSPNQPQLCSRCCPYKDSEPACRISRKENFCRNRCSLAS